MALSDAELTCRDCAARFELSEDERASFASQGRLHPPSRCGECRRARRQRQVESGSRPVAPGFRELKETSTTIACSACGLTAVVPFAARNGRPVYCAACFRRRRAQDGDE